MTAIYKCILLLFVTTSVFSQERFTNFDSRFTAVRELIIAQVNEGKVASISVAAAEDGEIVWEESFGWADIENKVKATPHTMYRLGSISKTITATGLMRLVEEGLVELDKPATEYLPDEFTFQPYEGGVEDVTVRRLCIHRAGIPAYAESFYEEEFDNIRPFAETVRRYGIIAYQPGGSFVYCNLGYEILARIIAGVSGMEYADFIENRVFKPLGMRESGVSRRTPFNKPYAFSYNESLERIPHYLGSYPGAEGNYASAHDLIRFAMFHLGDDFPEQEKILSDGSIDSMQAKYPPGNLRYGIGWSLDGDTHGYRSVYHGGEGPGADAMMRLFPDEDIAAVVLCNTECEKLYDIQNAIFEAMIPELAEPEEVETSLDSPPPAEPAEIYGTWKGGITAWNRKLDVELSVDSSGAVINVADQGRAGIELYVLTPTFMLGMFDARIPTPDNEKHPYRNRIAVMRDGDRLYGAVITVGKWAVRAGHYEYSSRIELER